MKLAVHSGQFHADDSMATYLLSKVFDISETIRTRDQKVINQCDIVIDVGSQYDHKTLRYDHHQPSFKETFDDNHTIQLSSTGLIYKHYGQDIIQKLLDITDPEELLFSFIYIYDNYIQQIDADDTGTDAFDNCRINVKTTSLPDRIYRYNTTKTFQDAVKLCESEFEDYIKWYKIYILDQYQKVDEAFKNRFSAHSSGKVLECNDVDSTLIIYFQKKYNCDIFFRLGQKEGEYRIQCVSKEYSFSSKKLFPEEWRGLRGEQLDKATNLSNGVFVHKSGFLGIFSSQSTQKQVLEILLK